MKFRPCIDMHNGKVKQIVGSSVSGNAIIENFVSDKPAEYYAELFKKDKLFGGHIIQLGGDNEKQVCAALKAFPNGLQIGGGINDKNALFYLSQGASHVIVTSYIFKDGKIHKEYLEKLENIAGKSKIVIDLSACKKGDEYYVVTDRWTKFTDSTVNKDLLNYLSDFCDEFLVHAVDVEGKKSGIEIDLLKLLGEITPIITTYAGGIKSYDDIEIIEKYGNDIIDFTIGSSLDIYGGNLSYKYLADNYK